MSKKGLTPQATDSSARYNEVVEQAQLAEHSDTRGAMVIKPYGFALWTNIKDALDMMIKQTGHQNAYFPMLIPISYLSKEADHVEWFAKECAVVTHHRLKSVENSDGTQSVIPDPEAKLEEEYIIRPTSETIIRKTYSKRIQSHRDLPVMLNQWANVMRREMRTRLFLRTSEFLRQEWHTAHSTAEEAEDEAAMMIQVYDDLLKHRMAIDGVMGIKSPSETFAWAEYTYTIEPMMNDGKALQICTSHYLGTNFGDAFDVTYTNADNEKTAVHATSRGMSTRTIGWVILAHGDDQWLVMPPAIAPIHVVIVPIFKGQDNKDAVMLYIETYLWALRDQFLHIQWTHFAQDIPLVIEIDDDDHKSPGWKFAQYEMQWVPIRVAVGKRDMQNEVFEVARRDTGEKQSIWCSAVVEHIVKELHTMQTAMLEKSRTHREKNTIAVTSREEFTGSIEGHFIEAYRDWSEETEAAIQEVTQATIRCIPTDFTDEDCTGKTCVYSWNPATHKVIFAKAY